MQYARVIVLFVLILGAELILASPCFSAPSPHDLATSPYWLKLLHAHPRVFGGYKSEVDAEVFFFAPNGRTDPQAELEATLHALENSELRVGPLRQPVACACPERHRYLAQELNRTFPHPPCTVFEDWKKKFNAESVSLIYASAYMNNPASMFAHTFLKVNTRTNNDGIHNELLDTGISFGAVTGDAGGITFALLGLVGGFPGVFSLNPYYLKVQEYNHIENRDLFEYRLKLSSGEIDRMLNHLWELGAAYFDYYFFDENCSYHLLSLLEVAHPEWEFQKQTRPWVIPADTVRIIAQTPGAVERVEFRPSIHRKLVQKLESMSPEEKIAFHGGVPSSPLVADALIDQSFEGLMRAHGQSTPAQQSHHRALLLARSRIEGEAPHLAPITSPGAPEQGHGTSKVSLGASLHRNQLRASVTLRPAFHDLLDADTGYLPFSQLETLTLRLANTRVEELKVLEITSLAPWTEVSRPLSWSVRTRVYSPAPWLCDECHAAEVAPGLGFTVNPIPAHPDWISYLLVRARAAYSSAFSWQVGPTVQVGTLLRIHSRVKLLLEGEEYSSLFSVSRLKAEKLWGDARAGLSVSLSPGLETRVSAEFRPQGDTLSQFTLGIYF